MAFESKRPPVEGRCFTSPVIEEVIGEACAKIADPEMAWLFSNCFPNTLDTTVTLTEEGGRTDAFIITGDIDAMWLRDSTNQVWPYLQFAKRCERLRALFGGLIRRQATCVLLDPYANAFYRTADKESQWKSDQTEMKAGVHERKYELDSLASVLRLAAGYFEATGDGAPFDGHFLAALKVLLDTVEYEQAGTPEQVHPRYGFMRTTGNSLDTLPGWGHGNPCRRNGMSRSPFRPSDDAGVFQYLVPANAMAAVNLGRVANMLDALGVGGELAVRARKLSGEMTQAIRTQGVVNHAKHGAVFAYEVDGFGSFHLMDDANCPNLLALPYLGFCNVNDPVYRNTRRMVLSGDNPYFHSGAAGSGIGSPHVGLGWIWPLGVIAQALTSTDVEEIRGCLRTLKGSNAGTGFMHEAFHKDNATKFTRHWFAWANTFFGELVLHVLERHPEILKRAIA